MINVQIQVGDGHSEIHITEEDMVVPGHGYTPEDLERVTKIALLRAQAALCGRPVPAEGVPT